MEEKNNLNVKDNINNDNENKNNTNTNNDNNVSKEKEENNKSVPPMYVFALGGLGEVGKNMYIVEQGNEVWIIDSGIKFSSEISVEGVIPSFDWLEKNKSRIKGLIITHGHEDHIGSIPHLLNKIKIPKIYAGRIAANLIWNKVNERLSLKPKIQIINNKSKIQTLNFKIEFFNVNHSIPDCLGVVLHSKNGTVVNTADFKFDFSPVGARADLFKMAELGKNGVTLLLSDSTNAQTKDFSLSESTVSEKIDEIVVKAKGRVITATFASNVFRVREIIKIALKYNRKIAVFGYSMDKIVKISRKIKYVNAEDNLFLNSKEVKNYDDDKLLILSTGTQGEELAALSKMAKGIHKDVKLRKEDTVVFASSAIPGNYASVEQITNKLIKLGCTVFNNKNYPGVHASGHGGEQEQLLMLNLLRPNYFFPVHGETAMQIQHAKNAIKSKVVKEENIFIMSNGEKLKVENGVVKKSNKISVENIYVDDTNLSGQSFKVINDRNTMSENGIIIVSVGINSKKNKIVLKPEITSKGVIHESSNKKIFNRTKQIVENKINSYYAKSNKITFGGLKNTIKLTTEKIFFEEININPIVIPVILNIES